MCEGVESNGRTKFPEKAIQYAAIIYTGKCIQCSNFYVSDPIGA